MSLTGNNILGGASGQTTGYDIDQSLRFNDDDTPYLSWTPGSAGNRKTWTWSGWIKHSTVGSDYHENVFGAKTDANNYAYIVFEADVLRFFNYVSSSANGSTSTSEPKYRDPAAWRHVVIAWDTTQSTDTNRLKIYINGEQLTLPATVSYPTLNHDGIINNNTPHYIGGQINGEFDGYLAEMHFIDGTALDASSFGETNADTNQWQAIKYVGSYGSNGFYLKFQDSSALGDDSSGNTNDFTATNLAATDQVLDSPTLNYCTLNPLTKTNMGLGANSFLTEGNLKLEARGQTGVASTMAVSSGKWYWEAHIGIAPDWWPVLGFMPTTHSMNPANDQWPGSSGTDNGWGYNGSEGIIYKNGSNISDGHAGFGIGDVVQFAIDMDNGKAWMGTNNTWINSGNPSTGSNAVITSGITGHTITPALGDSNANGQDVCYNFGQDSSFAGAKTAQGNGGDGEDFYYTPPTGFKALNTDNLDDPAIALPTDHFNTVLYTGDGTTNHSITGVGFQPDFVWYKQRAGTGHHNVYDSVRGIQKVIYPNLTNAEATSTGTQDLYAFGADGFTVGSNFQTACNTSGETFASWNWKAGGTASSNGDGSKTSSVSANPTAGFSIVTYTGDGTGPDTVGHGLSSAPELIIVKNRSSVYDWKIYNETIGNTKYLSLNTSDAEATASTNWNDTSPTASVFTVNTNAAVNQDTSLFVAYCFHGIDGYSKVGSYTGNSATDGPFIYTGFRPAFIMVKLTTAADGQWVMFDNKRDPDNPTDRVIYANLNALSTDVSSYSPYDILSNGFKSRIPAGNGNEASYNSTGQTYIYLAFAESPFKTSNAR